MPFPFTRLIIEPIILTPSTYCDFFGVDDPSSAEVAKKPKKAPKTTSDKVGMKTDAESAPAAPTKVSPTKKTKKKTPVKDAKKPVTEGVTSKATEEKKLKKTAPAKVIEEALPEGTWPAYELPSS